MISDADAATLPRVVVAGQRKAGVLLIGWHQWRAVQPFSFVVRKRVWLDRKPSKKEPPSSRLSASGVINSFHQEKNRNKSEPIATVRSPPSTRPLEACRILSRLGVACLSPDTCAVLSSVYYDNPAPCPSSPGATAFRQSNLSSVCCDNSEHAFPPQWCHKCVRFQASPKTILTDTH